MKPSYAAWVLFFAHNGPGPWPCCFCGDEITLEEHLHGRYKTAIHHINDDHDNNNHENLTISHFGCHISYHSKGVERTAIWRERQSVAQLGKKRGPMSPKHRAAISKSLKQFHTEARASEGE